MGKAIPGKKPQNPNPKEQDIHGQEVRGTISSKPKRKGESGSEGNTLMATWECIPDDCSSVRVSGAAF